MPNLASNYTGVAFTQISMQQALTDIKTAYELALINKTRANTIRASKLIKLVHCAVKTDLLNQGIHPSLINPNKARLLKVINPPKRVLNRPIILEDKELKLCGYLKPKNQDISIIPRNIVVRSEVLQFPTFLNGFNDIYGSALTEATLSINVRSQLSSLEKNFDTLYERTFAESLNLHLRCNNMVLGEVYMLPVKEYDADAAELGNIAFKRVNIEKYINAFQAINNRVNINADDYKYERCCLLLVDFDLQTPKIYNTVTDLINDGYLQAGTNVTMNRLDYNNFVSDILNIYTARFPANSFS